MKILIFEYISGGSFCGTDLPPALAAEGKLMRNALVRDLATLNEHELLVLCDWRCADTELEQKITLILLKPQHELATIFHQTLSACDAAWIIAPETDGILYKFSAAVLAAGKILLGSGLKAIADTANKLKTFTTLSANKICTLPTYSLEQHQQLFETGTVLKPLDGVGAEGCFLVRYPSQFRQLLSQINQSQYIIQPYLSGMALSISALFKQGNAWLLCVNQQLIRLEQQSFQLQGCIVNYAVADKAPFQSLAEQVGRAFPELWGYAGIDVIQQNGLLCVVEINPRLTTSYCAIHTALGINPAALVLQLLKPERIRIESVQNQTVSINLTNFK